MLIYHVVFFLSTPTFDLFLSLDCRSDILKVFKIDEVVTPITCCKVLTQSIRMRMKVKTSFQIICNSSVQNSFVLICQNINVVVMSS